MKVRASAQLICGLALVCACGGGDGPSEPAPSATVSGVVRDQASGALVAGASVSLGGVSTTSGQNGQFELRNVPVGAGSLNVSADGYDAFSQSLTVSAGANAVTVGLAWNGLFDASNFVLHLPRGVTTFRGVFVVMFGGTVDTRQLLRGDLGYYQQFPLSGDVTGYRQRMLEFAQSNGFAVLGGMFDASSATYSSVFNALTSVANRSGHPELANAPLLLHGHSARACVAYDFAATHPDRIIGFIFGKAACQFGDPARAATVPAYFFFGQNDPQVSADAANGVRVLVEQNRGRGALWAYAVERGAGHAQVEDHDVLFGWLNAVVAVRLAPGSAALRTVDERAGWLGDPFTFAIGPYPCLTGNKATASWLPNEQTARDWQKLNSGGAVTAAITC